MLDQDFIKELSSRAAALFPAARAAREKLENDLYKLLQASLAKLQLVSREEFDAQLKVLERAEQKITELEQRLTEMERSKSD